MNAIASVFELLSEYGEWGLQLAIAASGYAALLAAPVLLINLTCRRWMSAGQMGMLWGLVLIRLFLPMAPGTPLSFQNIIWPQDAEPLRLERAHAGRTHAVEGRGIVDAVSAGYAATSAPVAPASGSRLPGSLLELLPLVWLGGATLGLVWITLAHWQLYRRVSRIPEGRDPRLLRLWKESSELAGVRSGVPLVIFDDIRHPAIMGAIHPKLLLPSSVLALDDPRLRLVMLHELGHVRRFDVAINWALMVVRALHWWNPLFWLAAARFGSLREQACDAFAVRQGGQPARVYSDLLLTLAEREPVGGNWRVTLPASILGISPRWFNRRGIRNRLRALRLADERPGRWHTAAAVVAFVLLATCGLTDAKTPQQASDSSDWLPRATIDQRSWTTVSASRGRPLGDATYDVSKVLDHIAKDMGTQAPAAKMLSPLIAMVLRIPEAPRVLATTPETFAEDDDVDSSQPEFSIEGSKLHVHAPIELHAELQRCLQTWEESGFNQISIECQFLTGCPDLAKEMAVSWQYVETTPADSSDAMLAESVGQTPVVRAATSVDDFFLVGLATLTAQQSTALRESAQRDRRVNILQAPKVTLFNGQQGSILDVTSTPFVTGMRETTHGVRKPKITVVDEGLKIALRVSRNKDQSSTRLNAHITLSKIGDVRTVSASFGKGIESIQIPRVKRCRLDVASEVADGNSLLIGCVPSYDETQILYVLLTARHLTEP